MFRNPAVDVIVVLVIVLLFFGPKRLPGLGKSLGSGIREFKDSLTGGKSDDDEEQASLHTHAAPVPTEPAAPAHASGAETGSVRSHRES